MLNFCFNVGKFFKKLVESFRVLYLINFYKNNYLLIDVVLGGDIVFIGRFNWKDRVFAF